MIGIEDGADKMNKDIRQWGKGTIADLKSSFDKLDIQHRPNSPSPTSSKDALLNRFSSSGGMISKVAFKFPKHMVFVAKGVGKGTPISKAGTTTRKAKDWFNAVMESDIEKLADIVAENQADMVVNNILIK